MKANFPVEFMAALLTAESNNKDKIPIAVEECKRMKIIVLPPDINQSCINFTIIKNKHSLNQKAIRFGLSAIKNVGEAAISAIIKQRDKKKFNSLTDFCRRIDQQKVNKKVLESLIQVGAFDQFGKRAQLLLALEDIRSQAQKHQQVSSSPQQTLFKESKGKSHQPQDNLPEADELKKTDLLAFEKQLLGFYLTEHPLAEALTQIRAMASHQISDLDEHIHLNQSVTIGGSIKNVKKILTKKTNSEMAFVTLDDGSGNIELVVFPSIYAQTKEIWVNDQPVLVTGKVDHKDQLTILVESVVQPGMDDKVASDTKSKNQTKPQIYTIIINQDAPKSVLVEINQLLQANQGIDKVIIQLQNGDTHPRKIILPYTISFSSIKEKVQKLLKEYDGKVVKN